MDCQVCGRRLGLRSWRLADGRRWCDRHVDAPECGFCGFPLAEPGRERCCAWCGVDQVRTSAEIAPHSAALREHMSRVGLALPAPTRILLTHPGQEFRPVRGVRAPLGETRWNLTRTGLTGPITIRVVGGLPGHVFRRTLAHEYGHATLADGRRSASLPLEILEGFAECVAVEHLKDTASDRSAAQVEEMLDNADPVYGEGLRLVRPLVTRHGLVEVAAAIRAGRLSSNRP